MAGCLALLALPGLAAGPECGGGSPIAMPVHMVGKAALVPVSLPTGQAVLLLDTGADITNISRASAARLGIRLDPTRTLPGQTVGGQVQDGIARLTNLAIGALVVPSLTVAVADTTPADGVLGLDVLQRFDVDLDLAHGRVTLHPGGLCPGQPPPWTGRYQNLPALRTVTGRNVDGGSATKPYLMMTVALNEHSAEAMLDTGALLFGLVSPGFAAVLGLDPARLARDPQVTAGGFGPSIPLALHRFDTLEIGTQRIRHPVLAVGGEAERFPLVLGMDLFLSHRIWLSFSTDHIFLQPKSP